MPSTALVTALPATLVVRELRFTIKEPGCRTKTVTVVTTLLDPVRYPARAIAELYRQRWRIETNLRHLKTTMKMEVLHCHSVEVLTRLPITCSSLTGSHSAVTASGGTFNTSWCEAETEPICFALTPCHAFAMVRVDEILRVREPPVAAAGSSRETTRLRYLSARISKPRAWHLALQHDELLP